MRMERSSNGGCGIFPSRSEPNEDGDGDDEPFTEEDFTIIDAAFDSAFKRPRRDSASATISADHRRRRRLPSSVLALQRSNSFTLSPCQANSKIRYPVMKFGGQITYSKTTVDVERAALEFLKTVEAKRSKAGGQVAIGFDIEWKATFRKGGSPGKAAVVQMCVDNKQCHVMHIIHTGIPKSLQLILENSMLPKVGVGIGNDAIKIFKDYNVSVEAVEELSYLANQKLGGDSRKWSLASLTENFVSKQLLKSKKIQLGNWEASVLSKDQLEYAATDAFASWYLYEALRALPDVQTVDAENGGEVKDAS